MKDRPQNPWIATPLRGNAMTCVFCVGLVMGNLPKEDSKSHMAEHKTAK